jgi:hypothetical protein
VGVALYLAEAEEQNGKLASAWTHFVVAESLARRQATPQDQERAELARQRAAVLRPKLATLTVTVERPAPALRIARDGIDVPKSDWDTPFPLDRGIHAVTASAPGRRTWTLSVDMASDGRAYSVTVPELAPAGDAPPTQSSGTKSSDAKVLPFVLGGVGLVAVGVGTVFGASALSGASNVKSKCPSYPQCDASLRGQLDDTNATAQRNGAIATASLIAGGALVAAAVILLVVNSQSSPRPRSTALVEW